MFNRSDILYEDNHLLVVNKHAGELVQTDPDGNEALEDTVKQFIKKRDGKPGAVFLGVVHRMDRPVSGAVLFAKTSKALVRLNEMMKQRTVDKCYWAIVEELPDQTEATLVNYISRDPKKNKAHVYNTPKGDAKEARLSYKLIGSSSNYHLLEVELLTGRHHQIRAQLAKIGCPVRGDLKYGAKRSNKEGGISLHSRSISFTHPVTRERLTVTAPVPLRDNLWKYFDEAVAR